MIYSRVVQAVIFFAVFCSSYGQVLLTVRQGQLNGTTKIDRKGKVFYSFQRIPYASPPIGELRFMDPRSPSNWVGVRQATEDLPFCYQAYLNGTSYGQEDCLYLNVYTPEFGVGIVPKPVMVWIHGGGFVDGSGREDYYGPEYLMTENVVLVTINYRLNIFGFLSLYNTSMSTPGNAGLKDQTFALRWVRDNIEFFGGNFSDVTIFGESAGGVSVHYHVLSPKSKGLFSKAIIQSGTAISPWTIGYPNNGIPLAKHLNIQTENEAAMLASLRRLSARELFEGFQTFDRFNSMTWGSVVSPIIENQTDGSAFISEDPLTSIERGNYNDVPLLIGYTDAEGIAVDQLMRALLGHSVLITDFSTFIPIELQIRDGSETVNLTERIRCFYYQGIQPSLTDMRPFIQIYTDSWFGFPAQRAARHHSRISNSSIYLYRFSADTTLNVYKRRDIVSASYWGASHCDELGYLFNTYLTPHILSNSVEDNAIDRVVGIWANFARFGNPNGNSNQHNWWPVTWNSINYADIGTFLVRGGINPDDANMRFWTHIYDQYFIRNAANIFPVTSVSFILFIILNLFYV